MSKRPFNQDSFLTHAPKASGKTAESLAYSRDRATEILRLFKGVLPQSIMLADKKPRGEADLAAGSYEQTGYKGEALAVSKSFGISDRSVRRGALSVFPQNIGRTVLLLYSNPGDTVVDPFAGHNSRMELCVKEGRNYIGNDLSAKFMQFNRERAEELRKTYGVDITLFEGDSRTLEHVTDNSGDLTLTSPPYYDIEDYGDEPEQLGKLGSYENFMEGMRLVAKQNYRVLRPGSFCVWFVNDFREDGKFYPYHVDTINALTGAGFYQWDMMVVDLGFNIRGAFATQIVDQKILPKRHEYGIVMRKK